VNVRFLIKKDYELSDDGSPQANSPWSRSVDSGWIKHTKASGSSGGDAASKCGGNVSSSTSFGFINPASASDNFEGAFVAAFRYKRETAGLPTQNMTHWILREVNTSNTLVAFGLRERWTNSSSTLVIGIGLSGSVLNTITLATDTEYTVRFFHNYSDGATVLHITDSNGATVGSIQVATFANNGQWKWAWWGMQQETVGNTTAEHFHMKDLVIADNCGSITDIDPTYEIEEIQGYTDGSTVEFTPSTGTNHAANIDEMPPNNATDYNETPTADSNDKKDTFTIPTYSGSSQTCYAVAIFVHGANDAANLGTGHYTGFYDGTNHYHYGINRANANPATYYGWGLVYDYAPDGERWNRDSLMTRRNQLNSGYVFYERHNAGLASARKITTMVVLTLCGPARKALPIVNPASRNYHLIGR